MKTDQKPSKFVSICQGHYERDEATLLAVDDEGELWHLGNDADGTPMWRRIETRREG